MNVMYCISFEFMIKIYY